MPLPAIVQYKSVSIVSPDPTGVGGKLINDNLKGIADQLESLQLGGQSGTIGASGYSGAQGVQGLSGISGQSGSSGVQGLSGISGQSGTFGVSGYSGVAGTTGTATSGFSGYSGISGTVGIAGTATSGFSGYSGGSQLIETLTPITFDGGASVLNTTGLPAVASIPFTCTIVGWDLVSDAAGNLTIEVEKSSYANYPTTTSIAASAKPSLSAAQKNTDSTLTGWTTAITAGDFINVYISGTPTVIKKATLILKVRRT